MVSSPSACSEANAPGGAPPPPRGRVKNSPWKWQKPSTRQRWSSSCEPTPVATSSSPRDGRLGDQRLQLVVLAAGRAHLDHAAEREQRLAAALVVVDGHREARAVQRLGALSVGVRVELEHGAVGRQLGDPGGRRVSQIARPPPSSSSSAGG